MTLEEAAARGRATEEALTWLGTRWVHEARIKGAGVDCGQLLAAVYEAAGVMPHVSVESYPREWALHRGEEKFLGYVERFATRVDAREREPLPGDIVLFRYGRCLSHGGIVLEWPVIIHAYTAARRVTKDNVLHRRELRARWAGAWDPWRRPDGR